MLSDKDKNKLAALIIMLQDGSITSESLEVLDKWLAEDEDAFIFYCNFMKDITVLKRQIHSYESEDSFSIDTELIKSLAEGEQNLVPDNSDGEEIKQSCKPRSKISRKQFLQLMTKIAAVIFICFGLIWLDRKIVTYRG